MKHTRLCSFLLFFLGYFSPSYALYSFPNINIILSNESSQPVTVDVHWSHGVAWFSPKDSKALEWGKVIVAPESKVQKNFSIFLFPRQGAHNWFVKVHSLDGRLLASFSESSGNLIAPDFVNHRVQLVIKPNQCQVTLRRNDALQTQSAEGAYCINGVYTPPPPPPVSVPLMPEEEVTGESG